MILGRNLKTSTLFRLGAAALALRGVAQLLLDRSSRSSNVTDFFLGVLFGTGVGLLMIVAWRKGRHHGDESTGA